MRVELVGGPFDGATIRDRPDAFVFVGGHIDQPRGFRGPGRGRRLYFRGGERFLYAHDTHSPCAGCGGINDGRPAACRLCGARQEHAPVHD